MRIEKHIDADTDFGMVLRSAEIVEETTLTIDTELLREQFSNLLDLRGWDFLVHMESYELYQKDGSRIRLMMDTPH